MNSLLRSLAIVAFFLLPTAALSEELDRFSGTYAFAGSDVERAAHEEAVGILARRTSLFDEAAPAPVAVPSLELAASRDVLTIASEQGRVEGPVDGTSFAVTGAEGTRVTRTIAGDGAQIVEVRELAVPRRGRSRVSGVVRTDTYRLAEDGETLTRTSRIEGGSLRKPVEYQLTFRRSVQTARGE